MPRSERRPRDRFEELALFYAECYLGKEKLDDLLRHEVPERPSRTRAMKHSREEHSQRYGLLSVFDRLRHLA